MKQFVIFLSSFLLISCSQTPTTLPAPTVNNIQAGEQFIIALPENHTDGCTWHLSEGFDSKMVKRIKEVWHGPDKGIYYHLEAAEPGRTELHFVKRKYRDTLDKVTYIIAVSN